MQKKMTYYMVWVILASSMGVLFGGCTKECPEPKVIVEYKYIKPKTIKVRKKPKFDKYNVNEVEFRGKRYFMMDYNNASIMLSNWLSYKDWAENNYNILESLKQKGDEDGRMQRTKRNRGKK